MKQLQLMQEPWRDAPNYYLWDLINTASIGWFYTEDEARAAALLYLAGPKLIAEFDRSPRPAGITGDLGVQAQTPQRVGDIGEQE